MSEQVALSWSGGKDSAMALLALTEDPRYEVVTLLTTVTAGHERISMHGVRVELLREQANATGLPLHEVRIPQTCSNDDYERAMGAACRQLLATDVKIVAFGDLYLEDVRAYREEQLTSAGMRGVFPLWGTPTDRFMREVLERGFQAHVVCLDPARLPESAAGRVVDETFLTDLPPGVDPAGENGEFHTFVVDGPVLSRPIAVRCGERVLRDGFCYQDLLPA